MVGAILATDKVEVDPKSVLVLDLADTYSDRKKEDPIEELTQDETKPDLYTVLKLIKHAQNDTSISGIYLKLSGNGNGFAASQELKKSLSGFKSKGKFIYAFGDYIDQRAYHLASVADKIYCHPQGAVEWQGMSVEYVFSKH